jgi:hypothetical protein
MKRGRLPVRQRGSRRALGLGCVLVALGCEAPHYVSLGWNDSAVRAGSSTADAGMERALGSEATPDDFSRANARDRTQPCTFGLARVELRLACDARPLAACPELGETPARTLDAVLSSVLRECGERDNLLSVSFEQGCAIAFELASDAAALDAAANDTALPDPAAPDAAVSAAAVSRAALPDAGALEASALDTALPERASLRRCISKRLAAQRFECARAIACGEGVNSSPLTR